MKTFTLLMLSTLLILCVSSCDRGPGLVSITISPARDTVYYDCHKPCRLRVVVPIDDDSAHSLILLEIDSLLGPDSLALTPLCNKIIDVASTEQLCQLLLHIAENDTLLPMLVAFQEMAEDPHRQDKVEVVDTLIQYPLALVDEFLPANTSSGQGLLLMFDYHLINVDRTITKWLVETDTHISDTLRSAMEDIYYELLRRRGRMIPFLSGFVPSVLNSPEDLHYYHVNPSIEADHYVLYACADPSYVKDFVATVISRNFDICTDTLPAYMDPHFYEASEGYLCICLVGINDDWTYRVLPITWIAIDKTAPEIVAYNSNEFISETRKDSILTFSDSCSVLLPANRHFLEGKISIRTYASYVSYPDIYNCTFVVNTLGDVATLTIHRNAKLSRGVGAVEDKVIDLTPWSQYTFTYTLHLENGDNFIPFTVTDTHDNSRNSDIRYRR